MDHNQLVKALGEHTRNEERRSNRILIPVLFIVGLLAGYIFWLQLS